ncbi:3740_t:CDS:2 [Ambispora leptoticha]|uniref:3740_t:CDS:1 n=1 Tax=Ambispora leptoticha TaxID=144679 RepID=A0A9N8VHS0_9GLOM|nr:3740_t:CDS:2 [Ambispora leptoticha]
MSKKENNVVTTSRKHIGEGSVEGEGANGDTSDTDTLSSQTTPQSTTPPTPGEVDIEMPDATKTLNRQPRQLECYNCGINSTPLWRRTPDRMHSLCNACGLYYKQYSTHRPLHIIHKTRPPSRPYPHYILPAEKQRVSSNNNNVSTNSSSSTMNAGGGLPLHPLKEEPLDHNMNQSSDSSTTVTEIPVQCNNCGQTQTPLWRKNERGQPLCNACGLYAKMHNRDRPIAMRKSKIQRRRRDWGSNFSSPDPNASNVEGSGSEEISADSNPHSPAMSPSPLNHSQRPIAPLPLSLAPALLTLADAATSQQEQQEQKEHLEQKEKQEIHELAQNEPMKPEALVALESLISMAPQSNEQYGTQSSMIASSSSDSALKTNNLVPIAPQPNGTTTITTNQPYMPPPFDFYDESSFMALVEKMTRKQVEEFLVVMERRCEILKTVLKVKAESSST